MPSWLDKIIDATALVYALLYFPAPFFWLVIHPAIHFWRRFGNRSFWIAVPVWVVIDTALLLLRHRLFAERAGPNPLTAVAGAGLIALALWLGHCVHGQFGLKRLGGLPEINPARYPGGVVSSGVYGVMRHPRYVEFMLTFLGLALLSGAVGIFLLAFATILLYYIVAPLEERELRDQYGAPYEAYARAVPRFIPRFGRKPRRQP